jgi:hypothetical protein
VIGEIVERLDSVVQQGLQVAKEIKAIVEKQVRKALRVKTAKTAKRVKRAK